MATTFHIQTEMVNEKHRMLSDFVTVIFVSTEPFRRSISLLPLMRVITCVYASILGTSLTCVKNNIHHFSL